MAGVNKYNASQKAYYQQNGRIDRIIGDKKRTDDFRNCIEFKWNIRDTNEFKFTALLLLDRMYDEAESEKSIQEKDGKITTVSNLIKNEYYDIGDDATEHEFTLYKAPKNGAIPVSLLRKGLSFYHQPPLTDEYKSGWSDEFGCEIDVNETSVINTKSNEILVHRPEQFVNSYAIYNDYLTNRIINPGSGLDANYYNGKLGHLHRYCAYLPGGERIWLKSVLDKDILNVILPGEILNDESLWKAGLRVGPTFGYSTIGGTMEYGDNAGRGCYLYRFSLSEAGDVSKLTHYGCSFNAIYGVLIGLIYSNTSDAPNARQGYTSETYQNSTTNQWWDLTFSSAVSLTAADWWLGVMFGRYGSTGYYSKAYRDTGTTAYGRNKTTGFSADNTPPATAGTLTSSNHKYSIYATYTASGGSAFVPLFFFLN